MEIRKENLKAFREFKPTKRRLPRKLKKKCKKDLILYQIKLPAIRQIFEYRNRKCLMDFLQQSLTIKENESIVKWL